MDEYGERIFIMSIYGWILSGNVGGKLEGFKYYEIFEKIESEIWSVCVGGWVCLKGGLVVLVLVMVVVRVVIVLVFLVRNFVLVFFFKLCFRVWIFIVVFLVRGNLV